MSPMSGFHFLREPKFYEAGSDIGDIGPRDFIPFAHLRDIGDIGATSAPTSALTSAPMSSQPANLAGTFPNFLNQ